MSRYWIGVASREHVGGAVAGGFAQLNHGMAAPLARMSPGDRIVYYSPRERMGAGEPLQAFTAAGEILAGDVHQADAGDGFHPYRRDVRYFEGRDAPIRPLLPHLSFTKDRTSWGVALRRGTFAIEPDDYRLIADAMGLNEGER